MSSNEDLKFPQFDCVISNTMEDYDSEVEQFFLVRNVLATELSKLRSSDKEWSGNYEKMLRYLSDLSKSIVRSAEVPSHQFLIDLSLGDELEDDTMTRLIKAKNPVVGDVTAASIKVREMMYWFVRNSKEPRFSKSFTPQRFQGLPFLRLALVYRSVALANAGEKK